jgi:hypothetical protein
MGKKEVKKERLKWGEKMNMTVYSCGDFLIF